MKGNCLKMPLASGKKHSNRYSASTANPTTNSTIPVTEEKAEYIPLFVSDISEIMRGYGDCAEPLHESVVLVEKIMIEQMRSLLIDVINISMERQGTPHPQQIDFEFLLRKYPTKLSRLQKHLFDMKFNARCNDLMQNGTMPFPKLDYELCWEEEDKEREVYDEEKVRRIFRADRISLTLDGKQYQAYSEARKTSFCHHSNAVKEKLAIILNPPTDVKLSEIAYTILGYFAHETIATLVDYALLTRLDSNNRRVDPFSRIASEGTTYKMMHACPEVTQGRAEDGYKPITVQEIQEAMRRHASGYEQTIGMYRSSRDRYTSMPYLAI